MEKICKKCNIEKDINEFYIRKISKDGYRNYCKLCEYERSKKYNENNKEYLDKKAKIWREANKTKLKENVQQFHLNNPEYRKEYQLYNKEKINERNKKRRETDVTFKLKENIRHLISNSLKNNGFRKNTKTIEILGCTNEFFKYHIEKQWSLPHNLNDNGHIWMDWSNYGNPKDGIYGLNKTWDLDHIIPLITAITEEGVIRLNHYTNLQPLCSYINRINKRGKLNYK